MLVYYFVPFIVSNRDLLFWVSNGHNSVTVQNRTHVYMNFFDHKDLGNHLLQLCPKVVKHPVSVGIRTRLRAEWPRVRESFLLPFIEAAPRCPYSHLSKGYPTISPVMMQQGSEPDHWPPSNTVTRLWGVHRGKNFVLPFSFFFIT